MIFGFAVVTTFTFASKANATNGICDLTEADRAGIQNSMPFSENSDLLATIKQSDVVVAGEVHFVTPIEGRIRLIEEFYKLVGAEGCVAFELPYREQSAVDFMTHNRENIATLKSLDKLEVQPLLQILQNIEDYYEPMVTKAASLGMKVRSVDHQDNGTVELSMEQRNLAMSQHISQLHSKKLCLHTLFFVGKAHLGVAPDSPSRVQDLISQKGLKTTTLNIQMTKEKDLPSSVRSWALCAENAKLIINDYKTINSSSIPGDPFLLPFNNSQVKWKDFDFTIFLPPQL